MWPPWLLAVLVAIRRKVLNGGTQNNCAGQGHLPPGFAQLKTYAPLLANPAKTFWDNAQTLLAKAIPFSLPRVHLASNEEMREDGQVWRSANEYASTLSSGETISTRSGFTVSGRRRIILAINS